MTAALNANEPGNWTVRALLARAEKAEAALDKVRARHKPCPTDPSWCDDDGFCWPCATIRAIEGES